MRKKITELRVSNIDVENASLAKRQRWVELQTEEVEKLYAEIQSKLKQIPKEQWTAWVTYRFIERPIRFGEKKVAKSFVLIGGVFLVGVVGLYIHNKKGVTPYNFSSIHISEAKGDWEYPDGLIKRNGFYSTSEEDPTVLLVGDSHIEQYGPRLVQQYAQGNTAEIAFLTGGGCPLIPKVKRDGYPHCDRLFERMDNLLDAYPIKTIVIGFCFNCYLLKKNDSNYFFEVNDEVHNLSSEFGLSKAKGSFYDFVRTLSETYEIIVLTDTPNDIRFHPNHIFGASLDGKRQIPISDQVMKSPFIQSEDQIKLANELDLFLSDFSIVVHQYEKICPNGICNPINSNGWPI